MHKIVFNRCYGGFSLSMKAVNWLENNAADELLCAHIKNCRDSDYHASAFKEQLLCYKVSEFFENSRHHKDLVAVVETLGKDANGANADLGVATIWSNQYMIENYDGAEDVVTPDADKQWIFIN